MENRAHALAAGLFVLIASALLVLLAVWLTRDTTAHQVFELSSREPVTGLQAQAGVRFRGVTVGKVESIGFDPKTLGNVLIRISTEQNVPITRSTYATLGFQGVTGLAFVQLEDTGDTQDLLATSDATPARIPMRASLLSRLSDQGTQIMVQLEETSRRMNQLLAPEHQKELLAAIRQVGQSARAFDRAAASVGRFAGNADRILDAQLGPERMNLPLLVTEMNTTFKALQSSSLKFNELATDVQATSAEVRRATQAANQADGALDKLGKGADALVQAGQAVQASTLPRVNRAAEDASRSARALGRTAAGLNDNPQSLVWGNGALPPGPGEPGFAVPATQR